MFAPDPPCLVPHTVGVLAVPQQDGGSRDVAVALDSGGSTWEVAAQARMWLMLEQRCAWDCHPSVGGQRACWTRVGATRQRVVDEHAPVRREWCRQACHAAQRTDAPGQRARLPLHRLDDHTLSTLEVRVVRVVRNLCEVDAGAVLDDCGQLPSLDATLNMIHTCGIAAIAGGGMVCAAPRMERWAAAAIATPCGALQLQPHVQQAVCPDDVDHPLQLPGAPPVIMIQDAGVRVQCDCTGHHSNSGGHAEALHRSAG